MVGEDVQGESERPLGARWLQHAILLVAGTQRDSMFLGGGGVSDLIWENRLNRGVFVEIELNAQMRGRRGEPYRAPKFSPLLPLHPSAPLLFPLRRLWCSWRRGAFGDALVSVVAAAFTKRCVFCRSECSAAT